MRQIKHNLELAKGKTYIAYPRFSDRARVGVAMLSARSIDDAPYFTYRLKFVGDDMLYDVSDFKEVLEAPE